MRETLKRLFKMMIGYGAIQWAGPALSFIFTPIITRVLSKADYGIADYLLTISSAVGIFALFGIPQAVAIHFNDKVEDPEWQRTVTGSGLALAIFFGVSFGLLLIALAPVLTSSPPQMQSYTWLVQLIGLSFVFGTIGSVITSSAQSAMRVRWGMVFSAISVLGTLTGNVLLIVVLRLGVTGIVFTPILIGIGICLMGLIIARSLIGKPSIPVMKTLLYSGAAILPTLIAVWALQLIDRFFLVRYVSVAEIGDYAIANKFASMVYVAMTPIYSAWTPLALASQHQPGAEERYVSLSRYLIAIVLILGLGIGLFATEILLIMTRVEYLSAAPYVGFLAYIYIFNGFGTILSTGAYMGKQLKQVSASVVLGALINIVLNYLFIPHYGVWGATIATIIGYGIPQALLYLWLRKSKPIPYPTRLILGALLIQFGLLIVGLFVPMLSFPIRIAIKTSLFLLLPVSYLVLGLITPMELRILRSSFLKNVVFR